MTVLNFGGTVYAEDSDEQLLSKGMWHDPVTGLIWMRCSLGQKLDNDTCVGDAKQIRWIDAMLEAEKMSYAGYNDWYLPSIDDLRSLRKCSTGYKTYNGNIRKERYCNNDRGNNSFVIPAIDQLAFPNTPIKERGKSWHTSWFWSSTYTFEYNKPLPYIVEFGIQILSKDIFSNEDFRDLTDSRNFVRFVRSGNSHDDFSKNLLIAKDLSMKEDEYVARVNNENIQKRKKEEEYVKKTVAFRKSVKEGDDTTFGVVIQVKGSLVKIQTEESKCTQRDYKGNCDNYINDSVEKWFKRSEIYPLE